jgi:putative glycosyltransferase (TIGR04372 family)
MRIMSKLTSKFYKLFEWVILLLYSFPALILWFFGAKVPNFSIARIGHLASEPDCYIKEHLLKKEKVPRTIFLASSYSVANKALAKLWGKYFIVIKSRVLAKILRPLSYHPLTRFNVLKYIAEEQSGAIRIATEWGDRKPILQLTDELVDRGDEILGKLGLPRNSSFVCIHVRESGYSPHDENFHEFRNSSICNYDLAINWLIERGLFCIRVGDATMRPIGLKHGMIDYALSPYKSDWMDIYLSAKCKFFIGTNSGPIALAAIMGTPLACVNMAPMVTTFPWGPKDIGIPKLYRDIVTGRLISFKEIFSNGSANFKYAEQFKSANIELIENSPEEILDLVREQYNINNGVDNSENLKEVFRNFLSRNDYAYGSSSNIGSAFIKKYQELLN